jgi:ATP-dependent helicase HrpA
MQPSKSLPPRSALADIATRDRGRLIGRWQRLSATGTSANLEQVADLARDIESSMAWVAARRTRVPTIRVDESLPIAARSEEIVRLIQRPSGRRAGR